MKKTSALLLFAFIALTAFAQKKPLDHSVYDSWKSLGTPNISKNGNFLFYYIQPQEGDNTLVLSNLLTGENTSFERGSSARLSENNELLTYTIKPFFSQTKQAKLKKKRPDDMPKDSLGIYLVKSRSVKKIPYLKGFRSNEGSLFIAYQTTPPADTAKPKKDAPPAKPAIKKEKDEGSNLFVYKIASGTSDTIKYVTDYSFDKSGEKLYYVRKANSRDSVYKNGLYVYYPATGKNVAILEINAKQSVKLPDINDSCGKAAFFANLDTTKAGKKNVSVFVMEKGSDVAAEVLNNKSANLSDKWRISDNMLIFSKDGKRLFFGMAPILPEKDTTIDVSEKAKLDIWNYKQPFIQPYQLLNLQRDLRKAYLSVLSLDGSGKVVQLADEDMPNLVIPCNMANSWGYSNNSKPYEAESQWSSDPHTDIIVINISDGSRKYIRKDGYYTNISASENGKYLTWFDLKDNQFYSYNVAEDKIACMTAGMNVILTDEMHDTPEMNSPYGTGGWMDNDKALFIYDRYDVWRVDPEGKVPPVNLTDGLGRRELKTFRIVKLEEMTNPMGMRMLGGKRIPMNDKSTIIFSVFDNVSKYNGYYSKDLSKKKAVMQKLILEPYSFAQTVKAREGKSIIFYKHNFNECQNVWVTTDLFKTQKKISDINPQQSEYNWGTVSLYKWKTRNGFESEGILYKPEDFDSTKKYPMIVYFYETHSQNLYSYLTPQPSRSTVNIPYFVSNGYLVFTPDIHYTIGHPGQSALDCIVPGVELLCQNSWVDRDNIGIQGQSWGGYQVAYMVTRPDVFKWKAAGAGAPVANMTSAYGGIRWGSGLVRQFQYEGTQSRIGKNLWDGFDLYIENSPLFGAPNVQTPLLIMHNDKDDAVPWYQGIEYFTALKRLGKPVWMLQYNDELHNLRDRVNAKDLSIRLQQFFDHFLKGKPMPVWMKTGVPATLKGIDWGFELTE
jgi:dipeptidyl aminopeptidase/acylaminoacyl peptidase